MEISKKEDMEEWFVKKNHLERSYGQAKLVDPELWNTIQGIRNHYSDYSKYCKDIVQGTVGEMLGDRDAEEIHSIRFRVKDINSLLVKIVKKKALLSKEPQNNYDIEKYRILNQENYYKIITDISGIRILIRYREQWQKVHEWIWKKYYRGTEYYLGDFVRDYKANIGKPFIVEKPKIYYRNEEDRIFYEQTGKDIFEFRNSREGYNSIHYLVNIDGKYMEIQMRTLFDEAWSECTHDVVYKATSKEELKELKYLSKCLAQQINSAEMIANLIYEKVNKKGMIYGIKRDKETNIKNPPLEMDKIKSNVEERIHLLESQTTEEIFDGNIDSIL